MNPGTRPHVLVYMKRSKRSQSGSSQAAASIGLAKTLAPEDIRPGDFVALLHEVAELPSFFWCGDAPLESSEQPIRMQFIPEDSGLPLRVKSICLPFVLVRQANGQRQTLDIRRSRLARLDAGYARAAWKAHRSRRWKRRRS